jgi:hypothetical protein
MGLLKKLSFNAGQMNELTGGVTRLRGRSKDGEVELMRIGDIEHVTIYPTISGAWEIALVYPSPIPINSSGTSGTSGTTGTSGTSGTSGGSVFRAVTLHLEMKKKDLRYYCDVRLSSSERKTFPVYIYPGNGVATTMFIQASDVIFTSTLISCQLLVWENHGTLGEEQTTGPSVVTGMTWVCNYSHDAEFSSTDYYPLNGYIVPKTYENWMAFVADAWTETLGKYSVDVTMVKASGDFENRATLEYLNNNPGSIGYNPSGEVSTSLAPLTSIKDDYSYATTIQPFINKFTGWASSVNSNSSSVWTLSENYLYYETTDPPSYYLQQVEYIGSWQGFHPGLLKANGEYTDGYGGIGHTTPYNYETYKSEIVYDNGSSFTNTVSISGNPSQVISYEDTVYPLFPPPSPPHPNVYSQWRRYTSGDATHGFITWTYDKGIDWNEIQLPCKNTRIMESRYSTANAIAYSADTSGSGGSGGL